MTNTSNTNAISLEEKATLSLRDAREFLKGEISKYHGGYSNPENYISHGKVSVSGHEGKFFFLIYKDDAEIKYGVHVKTGEVLPLKVEKK